MSTSSGPSTPQRVLACILCQQRKVKCDRKFPCANCTKFRAQCVPATASRRRRQRFSERELLNRIRKYEDLLRRNGIKFKPLHGDGDVGKGSESPNAERNNCLEHEQLEPPAASGNPSHEPSDIWNAMRQSSHGAVSEIGVRKAWEQVYPDNDNILFGSRRTAVELSTLHPEPVKIFKLWQIYLNNLDPLLKVTHTPSLQGRLIEVAGDVVNISPTLEALMFGIYSVSIMSLTADECQAALGSSKDNLLARYQSGCQQALLNCGYLRTSDRECLTALYLFLLSIGSSTDPRSLYSMFGVAIRIAYRMGVHSELAFEHPPFEAEMRRRLWWSLKLLDSRISELADYKTVALAPTWDCRIPLNVNDSDLRPEMTEPPSAQGTFSEALFVVVRSEVGEFARHSRDHLGFASLPVAKDVLQTEGSKLDALERKIEDKYLRFCNPDNPLHYMTIWTARTYFAKNRLLEHYSRYSNSPTDLTDTKRDAALCHAIKLLSSDTKIMTSPLTKGYLWLTRFYFPFPAYMHILQDLRRRPVCKYAEEAWKVMSENFESRVIAPLGQEGDSPFLNIFAKIVLPAWEARETIPGKSGKLSIPKIVLFIRERMARKTYNAKPADREQEQPIADMCVNDLPLSIPMGLGDYDFGLLYDAGGHGVYAGTSFDIPGHQLDWATIDWGFGGLLA